MSRHTFERLDPFRLHGGSLAAKEIGARLTFRLSQIMKRLLVSNYEITRGFAYLQRRGPALPHRHIQDRRQLGDQMPGGLL